MASLNNNSRNIANLLRQDDLLEDQINRLRAKVQANSNQKPQRSSNRQISNLPAIQSDPQVRPSSQQQLVQPRPKLITPPTLEQSYIPNPSPGPFGIPRRRRDTPEDSGSLQIQQLTGSANNVALQVQALEQQIHSEARRNRKNNEEIQLTKMKLDENARYFQEKQAFIEAKFQAKIAELQAHITRDRHSKAEFQQKVGSTELGQKEMVYMVKNIQDQYASELLSIKSMVQEKRAEDQAALAKQKEKSTALFLEVVRLGDSLEKAGETLQSVSSNFEGRVQYLESKLQNNEKNLVTLAQRSSSGNDMLGQFGEKVLGRLQAVQSNLLILGKEQLKDKQSLAKQDNSVARITDDLNNLLRTMQSDFTNRLQSRVTEIVNRIVYEREQRMKSQEDIKKNLDMRERLIAEKQLSEKDQLEGKYSAMDSQVRNQFMRKEESIRALQQAMQEQERFFQKELDKVEKARQASESVVSQELKRLQDNFRNEYDIYKGHQMDLVQKMTEIIRNEVNARMTADVDLKELTSSISTFLAHDLNNFKETFSTSNKKMVTMMKELKAENSERAAQLSHYVDEEVRKLAEVVTNKYNSMKNVFTKLSEHFRNHLISTQTNRKNFQSRISTNERDFEVLKNEVNSVIDEFHSDLETRLRQQKQELETFTFKKQNQNTIRLNKLEEYVNQHFDLFKEGLEGNKQILNARLNNMSAERGNASDNANKEFKELVEMVHKIKQINENFQQESEAQIKQVKHSVTENDLRNKEDMLKLKTDLSQRLNDHDRKFSLLQGSTGNTNNKIVAELNEIKQTMNVDRDANNQNFQGIQKDIQKCFTNVSDLHKAVEVLRILKQQAQQHTDEEIAQVRSQLTILQTEVKSSDKTIHEDINRLIEITDMLKSRNPQES